MHVVLSEGLHEGEVIFMEEVQQLVDLVSRASRDEELRQELVRDAAAVSRREGFSPAVASVVRRLVPQLALGQQVDVSFPWWN